MAGKPLSRVLDSRRLNVSIADTAAGGDTEFVLKVGVDNPGEAIVNVGFPCKFTEEPSYYAGVVMDPSSTVTFGSFPFVCPVVRNFTFTVNSVGSRLYVGASILVLSSGVDLQTIILHLHFKGKAIRGPAG